MTIQTSRKAPVWGTKTRALAAGLLVAAMMVASMMAATPAQSSTTFTVNSTADTPDASTAGTACDTDVFTDGDQCTLRAAIQQANATTGADAINFAIPGTGVKTIVVGATGFGALPAITDPVTIDGYTQPGSSPNTKAVGNDAVLKIELNGANVNGGDGLLITHVSGSCVIRGLAINRFPEGISIQGDTVGNRIEGNFIGTDKTGTKSLGNSDAAVVITGSSSGNTVGGTTVGARNVISGNEAEGVLVRGTANEVLGNRVGTTANGTGALANALDGVSIQGSNNFLGDGTAAGSNTIAFNGDDGVSVTSGSGNEISRNSVFSNAGIGIDLEGGFEDAAGNTANDPGDIDTGSNGLQNKPVISSAKTSSTKTTITGNSPPSPTRSTGSSSSPTPVETRARSSSA